MVLSNLSKLPTILSLLIILSLQHYPYRCNVVILHYHYHNNIVGEGFVVTPFALKTRHLHSIEFMLETHVIYPPAKQYKPMVWYHIPQVDVTLNPNPGDILKE
jgi:hypothetical protein